MAAAGEMWSLAERLDALHGGDAAWEWTDESVARLVEEGRQEDPEAIRKLARVLEDCLERERSRRRGELKA